jgi:hypothetical protein
MAAGGTDARTVQMLIGSTVIAGENMIVFEEEPAT